MSSDPTTPVGDILRRLLKERGIDRFALFLTQQEGKLLPGGVESISGFVLTELGEVYGFWLDWEDRQRHYVLDPWYRVEDPSQFAADPEYRRAADQLGLNS